MTSSVTPGRMVGLIMPTTPRQLENAMSKSFCEPVGHHSGRTGDKPIIRSSHSR
jgi:hypothetical protein